MKQKVDEEVVQQRIDRHFRWPDANYRLNVMEEASRAIRDDPNGRYRVRIVKKVPEPFVSPLIPFTKTGLILGPDGKPL